MEDGNAARRLLLEDKTPVIYAAGGAIGGAVARAFAREGARLFLTGRANAKWTLSRKEITAAGGVAETAQVDALEEKAVDEHINTVVERAGGVDISFNAIGPGARGRTEAPYGADRRGLRPADRLLCQLQFHHGDRRGPADERPGLRCDRDIDSCSRSDAGSTDRQGRTGLGRRRGVFAFPGARGGAVRCAGGLSAFPRDPGDPLIEANFATAGQAAGAPAQFQAVLEQGTVLKRLPALAEVADTAAFIASDRAGAMTATVANLSAGSIAD